MRLRIRAALAALVLAAMFSVGCGDTFRPIAIPIIQTGGQPQATREAVVVSTAGTGAEGDTTHIDVSGDTNVGQVTVGRNPVHAALIGSGTITAVVNKTDESIAFYQTLSPQNAQPPAFVSLPVGSAPVYAYSNVPGSLFVAESGSNKVGVVNLTGTPTALVAEIAVGSDPEALVGTPDGSRLFVANKGSNTVNVIDTGTNALLANGQPFSIPVGTAPSFLAVNSNGTRVFVVNSGSGNVSVIDTSTDTATNVAVGANPNYAFFDAINNRLWVTNSGGNSVSVINVDPNANPALGVTTVSLSASCANAVPRSITVLADGSRAYVADSGCASVSVISALSKSVTKTIAVGTVPVSIASSPDSSKVYTANNGSGNATIIRTSDDTVVTNIASPAGTSPVFVTIAPF